MHKATISIKAESLGDLNEALDAIASAMNVSLAAQLSFSTTIGIEADHLPHLRTMLDDIAEAVASSECEVAAKAPLAAYRNRRLDPTPMERAIQDTQRGITGVEFRAGDKVARLDRHTVIDDSDDEVLEIRGR